MDVLTLDLRMADQDGFEVMSLLQKAGYRGPLLVISGQKDWLRKAACNLAAMNGLEITTDLQKPIKLQVLRDLLNTLLLVS